MATIEELDDIDSETIRVSYSELARIVSSYAKSDTPEPEKKVSSQRNSKSKRPAQQIYRPGQLKQNRTPRTAGKDQENAPQEEDWEDSCQTATAEQSTAPKFEESSEFHFVGGDLKDEGIQERLDDLYIGSPRESRERASSVLSESQGNNEDHTDNNIANKRSSEPKDISSKRRGKRPERQIYVPRSRTGDKRSEERDLPPDQHVHAFLAREKSQRKAENSEALVPNPGDSSGSLTPRKVQVKPKGGAMKVTVANEDTPAGPQCEIATNDKEDSGSRKKYNHSDPQKASESNRRGFDKNDNQGRYFPERGKGRGQQENYMGSRGRGRPMKADQPVRSYTKMRRSNSSDSRKSESAEKDIPSNVSESGTFPRTKSSRGRGLRTSNKDPQVGKSSGRDGERFYWGMRRQRTGSISSEASVGSVTSNLTNGSFYSGSSDFTEDDEPEHILDWGEEVEKAHLEELARLVHDGAQRLTTSLHADSYTGLRPENRADNAFREDPPAVASLNREESISAKINHATPREGKTRRRHRHRKISSRQSSRDSSVHSAVQGDDTHSESGRRRRRRRRHSSRGSQSSQCQEDGAGSMSGLQVTIGKQHRHVEVNNKANNKNIPDQRMDRGDRQHMEKQYEAANWDGEHSLEFNRSDKHSQKRQNEPPPRFRQDSGGAGHREAGGDRVRRSSGRQGWDSGNMKHDSDGGYHCNNEQDNSHGNERKGSFDQRSIHPAHDASVSRPGVRGRGRNNIQRHDWKGNDRSYVSQDLRSNHQDDHRVKGGLLHIPVKEDPPRTMSNPSASVNDYHPLHDNHSLASKGSSNFGSNTRGSAQGERHLFDPNNPSKPIVIAQSATVPPTFVDPEEHSSPSAGSGHTASSPESHQGHPGYPPPLYPPEFHPAYHFRPPMPPFGPPGSYPMGGFPPRTIPPHMFYQIPRMPLPDMNYFNGVEGDGEGVLSSGSRAQCRMMAEQILRDSTPFESQLGNILSRRPHSDDGYRMVNNIRAELQNRLEQVILLDIEVANKQNVEQTLWKSVYYHVIETHRKRMGDKDSDKQSKQRLQEVLDEGTRFFENLLKKLQSTYEFDLDKYTENNSPLPETSSRSVKLALLSSQRVMMFLGDIARYREQLADTTNYGKARHWYLKAQKIHPRNGRPYNQLAILAVYTKRKLDAVYYYMRSLAASNAIMTARESLMSLFDEVRRKVDVLEKKKFEDRRHRQQLHKKGGHKGPRVEIWVSLDGSSVHDNVDDVDEEDDLSSLSPIELNKRFILTYLNVHGKLFTKINFEVFAESSSLMLHEFKTLIQHSPCVLSSTRLLQLMVINMFSIDNTALKDSSLEENCRSLLQEHAVEIGLEMFGLLVQRCTVLLSSQLEADKKKGDREHSKQIDSKGTEEPLKKSKIESISELSDDLHSIFPALKTWVEWMMCHSNLWNPQPLNRPPDLGPHIDVWKNIASFCDLLNVLDTQQVCLIREEQAGYEQVVLHEDLSLAGFVPMLSAPQETFYAASDVDKRQAENWLRIEKLRLFGEYLCGVEPPMLAFNVESGRYYSVAPSPVRSEEKLVPDKEEKDSGDESDDVVIEDNSSSGEHSDGNDNIEKLKAQRGELNRRKQERERSKENTDAILDSHRHAKIELEIRPIFLIPDTNCFIDHFTTLKKILETKKYTFVVPLVVINELDGLSRGARDQQYDSPDHAHMVKTQAHNAVDFLEAEFETKNSHLRAQTAKGTVMETISFRSEENDGSAGVNDDIILSCCLHYCKDNARDFMPREKDHPVRLYREVVLLTDDRNLRLKAHTCNVPVKDVPSFKKWSRIS